MRIRSVLVVCCLGIGLLSCSAIDDEINNPTENPLITTASKTVLPTLTDTKVPTLPITPSDTINPTASPTKSPTATFTPSPTRKVNKSVPEEFKSYIGYIHPPLPEGFKSGFGELIRSEGYKDFAADLVHIDQSYYLWFSKFLKRVNNKAYWEVVDILLLPNSSGENKYLIPAGCMFEQELDPEIVVIANIPEDVQSTRFITNDYILQAWRMNRFYEAIEPIPTEGIECYADSSLIW